MTSSAGGRATPAKGAGRDTAIIAGVRLSNPDRILYTEQGIRKLDLASYFERVAPWLLPHVTGRPLTLVRCPEGSDKPCFFQKHAGAGVPDGIGRVRLREKEGSGTYLFIRDLRGLVSLAQIGVLEIHTWNCRADSAERPDRIVFDLDPGPGVPWERLVEAAPQVRDRLKELELRSFLKTSGGKGLHVVVPIARRHSWEEVLELARAIAEEMTREQPQHYTATAAKSRRHGKIFIDYLRNARGATAIAPYSPRARPGATVATPLEWNELDRRLTPGQFTIETLPQRLSVLERDPWGEMAKLRQTLASARHLLGLM